MSAIDEIERINAALLDRCQMALDLAKILGAERDVYKAQAEAVREQVAALKADKAELVAALISCQRIASEAFTDWDNDKDSRVGKILLALQGRLPKYRTDTDQISAAIAKHGAQAGEEG